MGERRTRIKLFLLLLVTALAAFFRLYRIAALPPGDGYDSAYYGVDALHILRGARPIMLPPNREALFSYIVTACFLLLGASTQAIHVASALVGLLTVPATYLVAEELFADEEGFLRQYGGLVAALMMASSYWHLNWSRYGVRAILVPLFAALAFYFLWRGLRTGNQWAFVLCGASLGSSMYTYQAARLLPLLVVIGFVHTFWKRKHATYSSKKGNGNHAIDNHATGNYATFGCRLHSDSRQHWTNFLIVASVALLVFAPLGYYFLTHLGSFTHRVEQAFVVEEAQDTASSLHAILDQSVKALLAFNFVGDREPYGTIPGRPSLNPFFSALFFLGIGVSLARVKRPSYLFLLAWLGIMFIPATIAGKAPTAKRAIGTLPAVAMLVALGAASLPFLLVGALVPFLDKEDKQHPRGSEGQHRARTGTRLHAPWQALRRLATDRDPEWSKWLRIAWTILLAGGFIYSGLVTYRDYFVTWASNPDLFTHFEVGISAIGEYVGELPPDELVYVSPELPMHPGIRFHSDLREDVRGYNGRVCLVAPAQLTAATTYIIVPGKDNRSLDLLRHCFPQGRIVDAGPLHYGEPYFLAYRIPAGAEANVTPTHPMSVNLGDQVRLLGYDLDRQGATGCCLSPLTYRAGETIHLTLYYQGLQPMGTHYTVFTHLLGPHNPATDGPLWSQDDSEPCRTFYPTTSWKPGEIVIDRFAISIPAGAPAGEYELSMGFYNVWTMEHLPVLEGNGQAKDTRLSLEQVQIVGAD